jgi:predicted amidophosphoribosyltransferase
MSVFQFGLWLSWLLKDRCCAVCGIYLPVFGVCTHCLSSIIFPVAMAHQACRWIHHHTPAVNSPLQVWVAAPWSASVKTVLYQYKFLKRYEHTPLLIALLVPLLTKLVAEYTGNVADKDLIVVTHPPAKAGRVYPWGRVVARLAAQQGWLYQPQLLQWHRQAVSQKNAASRQMRYQQTMGALGINANKLLPQLAGRTSKLLLVLDDIVTTGATLVACTEALEQMLSQNNWQTVTNIVCVALTDVPL